MEAEVNRFTRLDLELKVSDNRAIRRLKLLCLNYLHFQQADFVFLSHLYYLLQRHYLLQN